MKLLGAIVITLVAAASVTAAPVAKPSRNQTGTAKVVRHRSKPGPALAGAVKDHRKTAKGRATHQTALGIAQRSQQKVKDLERRIAGLEAERTELKKQLAGADRAIRLLGRNTEELNRLAIEQILEKSTLTVASIEVREQLMETCRRLVEIAEQGDKVLLTYPQDDRMAMASLERAITQLPEPEKEGAQDLLRVLNTAAAALNGNSSDATKAAAKILEFLGANPLPAPQEPASPKPQAPRGKPVG